jgi:hypothetical protein
VANERSAQDAERVAKENAERLNRELEALRSTQAAAKDTYGNLQDRQGDLERLYKDEAKRSRDLQDRCKALEVSNEAEAEAASAYREALEDVSKNMATNVQLLVTVPKVTFNLGGNMHNASSVVPFDQIKQVLHKEMLPKFDHVTAVADQQSDTALKDQVRSRLQNLALELQQKVYELCPQAEGTVSWDGFGARGGQVQ